MNVCLVFKSGNIFCLAKLKFKKKTDLVKFFDLISQCSKNYYNTFSV